MNRGTEERPARERVRLALTGARSYEGADAANANRLVGIVSVLAGTLSVLYLPLDPPTMAIGATGWGLGAIAVGVPLYLGIDLLRGPRTASFDRLLLTSYVGLASSATLVWLGGGVDTVYVYLFLLWVGSVAAVHPAPRVLAFLALAAALMVAPFVYQRGWTTHDALEAAGEFIFMAALGLLVLALMTYVRAQRVALRTGWDQATEMARADALTGLGNRRGFDDALGAELSKAKLTGATASVSLIDVDRLKQINDELSHLEGDRCLRQVADATRQGIRDGDRAFRWGGDEFAILLPGTDLQVAEEISARIAARVASTCSDATGRPLTVSWGAAQAQGGTAEELLDRADLALLTQKRERGQLREQVEELG